MTTGTSPEPLDRVRRWAREQLDLPHYMSDEQSRRTLLKRLAELDFMPPIGWDSALRVAGFAPCDGDVHGRTFAPARQAVEETLRAEVEVFASAFFSLMPDARCARFQELMAACVDLPCLRARVESLRSGLDLPCDLPVDQSPEVNELLDQARRLFVLRPQERASRRLAYLKECQSRDDQWQTSARWVQAKFPRYAALEPLLFRELSTTGSRVKLREKIARRRLRTARRLRPTKILTRSSRRIPRVKVWPIVVGAVVVINLLRAFVPSNRPSSNFYPPRDAHLEFERLNQDVNASRRDGKSSYETLLRLRGEVSQPATAPRPAPPEAASSSPDSSLPSLPQTEGVEIHVAKSPEEAQEIVRQFQERHAQEKPPQSASPRVEMHSLEVNQARELLRQLREQQAQGGPSNSRDGLIRALEKAIENASGSSQKGP